MLTMMFGHVDQYSRLSDRTKCRFNNWFRLANNSNDRTVGGSTGINIEQFDSINCFDGIGDLPDDFHVPSFTEIRNAFNKLAHFVYAV